MACLIEAITWTNAGILLIGPLGSNFSEILIEIYTFSFKKMLLKMSSGKQQPFCLGLNVLIHGGSVISIYAPGYWVIIGLDDAELLSIPKWQEHTLEMQCLFLKIIPESYFFQAYFSEWYLC